MNFQRLLITVFLALSLSACMGVKFTYNNLDWLVPWYVEDFISLTDAQEQTFEAEFEQLWGWHRETELPKYIDSLKRLETDIAEQNITLEKIIAYQEETRGHYHVAAEKVVTTGIDLLSSLTDEQMADIKEIIADDLEEFEENLYETPKEQRIKKRIRNTEKDFRRWIGKLTNKQKAMIEQWALEVESLSEHRFQYVKASRAAFLEAMEKRADKEFLKERLLFLVFERDQLHTAEHLEARSRNRERMRELMITMDGTLTKKQRRRLVNKIKDYREPLEELVAEITSEDSASS